MRTVRSIAQVSLVLGLVVWIARPSRGADGGLDAAQERARVCHERQTALRPEFDKAVSEHNTCKKASDCAVLTPGCPFGCYVGVRASDLVVFEARARELVSQIGSDCRCMYKCTSKPRASCVHGRCAIGQSP
jgi:hypothetical protein